MIFYALNKIFYVIDIRDRTIPHFGTEEKCRKWLNFANPNDRQYYKLAKLNKEGKIELL